MTVDELTPIKNKISCLISLKDLAKMKQKIKDTENKYNSLLNKRTKINSCFFYIDELGLIYDEENKLI
jgi:hypothetical protein